MLKNIFIYLFIFISVVVGTPIFAGSAVYTYTPGGVSSTDPGVLALELTLGEDYSSELLSFGINVPITQVESITIDSNNFHNYIITDEYANSYLGKSVVDGVTYYNNNTFPELLAKFSDDQNERVGLNFANGGSSFDESSDDWVQSELLGKTITHMVINVTSYSKSTTGSFYNYSAEIDIEFHYAAETSHAEFFSSGEVTVNDEISFVIKNGPPDGGSAVYTYTPGGGSSTDPGVIDFTLDLGQYMSSDLISFGISVPITQVESITINDDNFTDYIIADEWTNSGRTVVDGVTYYDNKTFAELVANFSDDQVESVGFQFANGGSSFNESSDVWVQSELLGKTITHMVINVKSYSKSTTGSFYNYSAEIDIEFHYGGETDSDSISSILDVGGNSDGTKGFMYLRGYHWVNSDWELLQEGTGQTGMDYRGQQYVVSTDDLSNWNKESPFKLVLSYINSAGIHYDSTYYLFGGTANPVFSYSVPDSDSDGVWDTFDVHQGFNDTLLDTYLTQNGYAKTSDISDLREGSVMIEVIDGIATIDLEMEVSDDLSSGSWIELDGSATMNIEVDASTKFFRFKMAD